MSKPAAFQATYSDLRFVKSRKVAQVTLELPLEQAGDFVEAFGTPNPANEVWVAIARLTVESQQKERRAFAELPIAQQAALTCDRNDFRRFLRSKGFAAISAESAAAAIRELCKIESRSELATNARAACVFQKLTHEFEDWLRTPV